MPALNMILGAADPDELGVYLDFTLGKDSGMEQPAQKHAGAQLRPPSEVFSAGI